MVRILFVTLISSLFVLSSCTEEELGVSQLVEKTPLEQAESYLTMQPSKALFAAVNIDHATNHIKGIVIDKSANVRLLDMPNATNLNFLSQTISELDMAKLIDNSEIINQLESIETADLHRTSKAIQNEFTNYETHAEGSSNIAVAFRMTPMASIHESSGCGIDSEETSNAYTNSIITFDQIKLAVNGKIEFTREDSDSKMITNWLQSLVEANIES